MGRRRKRRKVILKPKRTLPKIFTCPHCGAQLVSVKKVEGGYLVICGNCGLRHQFEERPGWMPVDYYNAFVDMYLEGKISPPVESDGGAHRQGGSEEGGEAEEEGVEEE